MSGMQLIKQTSLWSDVLQVTVPRAAVVTWFCDRLQYLEQQLLVVTWLCDRLQYLEQQLLVVRDETPDIVLDMKAKVDALKDKLEVCSSQSTFILYSIVIIIVVLP